MRSGFVVVVVSILPFLGGCASDSFVVDPATVCRCDAPVAFPCSDEGLRWRSAVERQLEVAVTNVGHARIGSECRGEVLLANEWFPLFFNTWWPVDGYRHSLVGTLHHFDWYYNDSSIVSEPDKDWNLHVIPDSGFQRLIDDVEALHSESVDQHKKCGGSRCMEAEISPDTRLWANPWFFPPYAHGSDSTGYSRIEGRVMGFYGPWVMDAGHDFASEIHPAEMIWWKDRFLTGSRRTPVDVFWLMLMQDNTGRFDDKDNFDCIDDPPLGWEPWAQSPVSGDFKIAFEADPNGPLIVFSINEIFKRFVVTKWNLAASRDADDGTRHNLELNGKILVRVEEDQSKDTDLGVTFTGLCLRPDGKLQGFVSIKSEVGGDDDRDEEGFHVLYVARVMSGSRAGNAAIKELRRVVTTLKRIAVTPVPRD